MGFALYVQGIEEHYPPVANFNWNPKSPSPGETVNFDAGGSKDSDGVISLYEWDWDNDGIYDESHPAPSTIHVWADEGSYPVTLRVTDDDYLTAIITQIVTVAYSTP